MLNLMKVFSSRYDKVAQTFRQDQFKPFVVIRSKECIPIITSKIKTTFPLNTTLNEVCNFFCD